MSVWNWLAARRPFRRLIAGEAAKIAVPAVQKIKSQLGFGGRFGGFGDSMTGGAKWLGGLSSSGGGFLLDHHRIRQNARTAYFDTPQAKSVVDRFADTVADTGLRLESTPVADILGISQEEAEEWSQLVEQRFDLWARDKHQHRSEMLTFYQSHRLYQIFQQRDNDIFVRLYYSNDNGAQNVLQFEFLDPNQIMGDTLTSSLGPFLSGQDGIKRDERGREKSYLVWVRDPAKPNHSKIVEIQRKRSGRIMMLHGFTPDFAGQGRGYSRLAHALQEFEKLTDFTAAQVMRAIAQSQMALYVKPSKDSPASGPLDGLLTNGPAGPASNQVGVDPTPAADAQIPPNVEYCPMPEVTMKVGGVGVFSLQEGEDLKPFEVTGPADSYEKFVDAFVSHLAASMSMPVEVLLMKFNDNYSASRASLLLFWRVTQIWREEMAADYLNPIYEMWLASEIAAGRIIAPGWTDPRLRAAWLSNNWIGSPMPNIDPMRTAKADQTYAEMGATTLDRISRQLNGSDGKSNRAKLTREFAELPESPFKKVGK